MTKNPEKDKSKLVSFSIDEIGDNHLFTSVETPMKPDAFVMADEEKKEKIAFHFREIMEVLGLDLNDDSLKGTPQRVAKMYVDEIFCGLNPANKPQVALFENKYQYNQMLVEKNITFYSNCEHHFVPIYGKIHVLLYIKRQSDWPLKNQQNCTIFCSKTSSSRAIDYANWVGAPKNS